ncbi:MAG: PAS domain-containing protein, partial [Gemmatimonadetes bacterium]|nr:PAS domain-containing protein [Gemmatimonadota bacterium]
AGGVRVATARRGVRGDLGVLVAGCARPGFPQPAERLLLDVAANQAALGLQQAMLLGEQERIARELDARVAERTRELAAANARLQTEAAELSRARESLDRVANNLVRFLDSFPGYVVTMSPAGQVEHLNAEVLRYFGKTADELRSWSMTDAVHPDDLPWVVETLGRHLADGTPYNVQHRCRRGDGVYRWFQVRSHPVREADGTITGWYVVLTDIDDLKRAEQAMRDSERNLKLIIDTVPALVWSALPDGTADFFNQHYLEFVGYTAEAAAGWGWTASVHPDDLEGLAAVWMRSMATGERGEAEARMRRHDGEYFWFLFRTDPLRDERGEIVRWYGVNTNIEDRKRAEADLRRAYDSFADGQRLSRTGNFTADVVADEHVWSDELYRIFEFEPGSRVTVQAVRDVIHPEDLPAFDTGFERSMGGAEFDLVFRITTRSGARKQVRALAHLVERVAGRPLFIGAIQDVTEWRVAEEALDRARSELARVARAATLSTLTASIAHEVNQPLAGIVTNASTCLRMLDVDPPDLEGARETAKRTIRDGHRASDVITRLRAMFARREFTLEPVDLNEAIREVIALSSGDLQRNRVTLRAELADGLAPVTGDRIQLQQVILNLLLNAVDALRGVEPPARHLRVRTERDGGHARVTVRDTGTGVDPATADKLFDAFYSTKDGGMGIGLSVSRSIVEKHHGRLWVEACDGPGSTFAFSIPCPGDTRG